MERFEKGGGFEKEEESGRMGDGVLFGESTNERGQRHLTDFWR